MRGPSYSVVLWASLTLIPLGCGQSPGGPSDGAGGVQPTAGGSPSSGGTQASGGSGGTPGPSSGGSTTNGGAGGTLIGSGGVPAVGGSGSGGLPGTGGGSSSAGAVIVPDASWACGQPEGILPPEGGSLVFEAEIAIEEARDVGVTQYGERQVLHFEESSFSNDLLSGTFLTGGLDFELVLSNGQIELEQVAMLEADDGSIIYLRTCGVAPAGESEVRFVPDFEAPNSSALAWLNTGSFVGTRSFDEQSGILTLAVYDVSEVSAGSSSITLTDPAEDLDQPWDCSTNTGSQGDPVFTETVTLGGSISTGASKRGTRNVIPITGGTVSGDLEGVVLPGGADYQLANGGTVLDARYMLKSDDGEFVVVRNCGAFGALIPWFEAPVDGPYAFLNDGEFVSSDPGSASGGVSITFYERQ
jgi:hypothetical protein